MQLVVGIDRIARQKNCTVPQLALSWIMAQGPEIASIPGTKKLKYFEQKLKALGIHLTQEDLARIDQVLPANAAAGMRALNQ